MKKYFAVILIVFVLFTLVACRENGATSETKDSQYGRNIETDVSNETPTEYYTRTNKADVSTALDGIAGEWVGMGLSLQFYADGIWIGNTGDTGWRGNIEMIPEGDSYIVELVAIYITGPGGMHDSYGNLRKEALEIIETGEHDWWLPVYNNESFILLSGTYSIHNDRFVSQDAAGNSYEMERWIE